MTKLPRNINKAWNQTDSIEKAIIEKMVREMKDVSDVSTSPILTRLKATDLAFGERFQVLNWLIAKLH